MERRQLECFLAVIESGSFRAAAEKLFITQPAVSQSIKALEQHLGELLIKRPEGRGRQIGLTAAGEIFLPVARDVVRRVEEGRQAIAQLKGLLSGRLALGAVDVAAMIHLPDPLKRFNRQHPQLEISVRVDGSRPLLAALKRGEIDLAFVLGEEIPTGFEGRSFRDDPMRVIAPAEAQKRLGHRPGRRKLEQEGWISYPRHSVSRSILERAFEEADLPFHVRMEIDRPEVIFQLVRAGLGLAVLPEHLLGDRLPSDEVVFISPPRLKPLRKIQVLHAPMQGLAPAARRFLADL
ncbi:MAG: LysR family transcriptional regulator [bacterium]|nr:LysR family transcriptional regulator [bacterium]